MRHHAAQETHRASRPAAACSRRCCAGATEKISAMSRLTHVAGIHLGVECSITDAARSTPVGERPCHGRKARLVGDGGTPARACSMDGPGGSHYFFLTSSRLSRGGAPPGDSGEGWARTLAQRQRIAPRGRCRFPGRTELPVAHPPRGLRTHDSGSLGKHRLTSASPSSAAGGKTSSKVAFVPKGDPLSVSAVSQCPLRSKSDRSAALPRSDAMCHYPIWRALNSCASAYDGASARKAAKR